MSQWIGFESQEKLLRMTLASARREGHGKVILAMRSRGLPIWLIAYLSNLSREYVRQIICEHDREKRGFEDSLLALRECSSWSAESGFRNLFQIGDESFMWTKKFGSHAGKTTGLRIYLEQLFSWRKAT